MFSFCFPRNPQKHWLFCKSGQKALPLKPCQTAKLPLKDHKTHACPQTSFLEPTCLLGSSPAAPQIAAAQLKNLFGNYPVPKEIPVLPNSAKPPDNDSDLAGQLFGRLAVTAFKGRTPQRALVWICTCACGNTTEVRGSDLVSGKQSSCGCLQSPDKAKASPTATALPPGPPNKTLLGLVFGRLTVLACQGPDKDGTGLAWQCQCACGRATTERTTPLLSGVVTSCGCVPIASHARPQASTQTQTQTPGPDSAQRMQLWKAWTAMWVEAADPDNPSYMTEPGWKPCPDPKGLGRTTWRDAKGYLRVTHPDNAPDPAWSDFQAFCRAVGPAPSPKHQLGRKSLHRPHGPTNSAWGLGGWGRPAQEPLDEATRVKPKMPRPPTRIECAPRKRGDRAKNLAGHTFGMLSQPTFKGRTEEGAPVWTCTCSCGRTTDATAGQLLTEQVKHCGCSPDYQ